MTLIEQYISKAKFRVHVKKVCARYDPHKMFIDDVVQDFCLYYLERPDKTPNIRKLYGLMLDRIKHENRHRSVDFASAAKQVDARFEDD